MSTKEQEQVRYLIEFGDSHQHQWYFPEKERAEKSAQVLSTKNKVKVFEVREKIKDYLVEEVERKELK